MNLSDLKPNEGSTHKTRRVGRGIGSGRGKTCGRGTKGNKARDTIRPGFEGGQTPLHRRLPQMRGFTQPFQKEYSILNLSDLERFEPGDVITPEFLLEKHAIGDIKDGVRILGGGELTKKLSVRAHHFSKSAQAKIESLGGTVEKIDG
jgi:large subunit ribosomal protein L15